MDFTRIMQLIASGDALADGAGHAGKGATLLGVAGLAATQNLMWFGGVVFGAAMFGVQLWWEWYRQRRRSYLEGELYKARLRKDAERFGLDSRTIRALQESPDPDSTVDR